MDRRAFRMEVKEVEPEAGTFTGYLSVFGNTDAQGDVVERGAFSRTLARWKAKGKPIPLLWQHSEAVGGMDPRAAKEDEKGLLVQGRLELEVQRAREVLALMRAGVVNAMSIGYDVIKQTREEGVRRLKELRLYEGSLVLWPANDAAEVVAVKNGDEPDEAKQMEVQSVIFPKKHWDSVDGCKEWLADHDFKSADVDETSTSWRFRQKDPGGFSRMRTVCLTPKGTPPGPDCRIEAIVGMPKSTEAEQLKLSGEFDTIAEMARSLTSSFITTTKATMTATWMDADGNEGEYEYVVEQEPQPSIALGADNRAKVKLAIEALQALLEAADAAGGVAAAAPEPGQKESDPGESHSDDGMTELLEAIRALAQSITIGRNET